MLTPRGMPGADRPRRGAAPSAVVRDNGAQHQDALDEAEARRQAAQARVAAAAVEKEKSTEVRRMKEQEREARARAEAERRRQKEAQKRAAELEKQEERERKEAGRLEAEKLKALAAEVRDLVNALHEEEQREEQLLKVAQARLKRLPRSARDGGSTATDEAMLAVLASAADAVEKERAAYAPAFTPLRADPPSAAALAFAARARGVLHKAFDAGVGRYVRLRDPHPSPNPNPTIDGACWCA